MLAGRIGHLLGSTAPGCRGCRGRDPPAGCAAAPRADRGPRPCRLGGARARPGRPRQRPGWPRGRRDDGGQRRQGTGRRRPPQAWVAIGSEAIDGVLRWPRPTPTSWTPRARRERLGLRGWIPDPERLAVERLLLADRALADAAVRQELGPSLADERMGAELIETLQAYFDAGENIAEAARRLHLATRTVAYRHGEDRVPARLSARRCGGPSAVDGAADQAAAGHVAPVAAAIFVVPMARYEVRAAPPGHDGGSTRTSSVQRPIGSAC